MKRRALLSQAMALWTSGAAAVLGLTPRAHAQTQTVLTVSAAASLADAFREIGQAFEASRSALQSVAVRFNFAASGVLLQQLQQGAPVDVLASADRETMDRATVAQLVNPQTRADFATNALVLAVPVGLPAGASASPAVQRLSDLTTPAVRRVTIGKPATVPAGRYAQQALERAGLWQAVQAKLVFADSARQALDWVARGEVEAALIYRTDAERLADRVRVATVIAEAPPIIYPIAVATDSRHKAIAADFVAFVRGDAAQRILARHGFQRP